jgi:hypothetical protein
MTPVEETTRCYDQMAVVEKYERVISYLYPIAQSLPRKHGAAREMFLQTLLGQADLFFQAGKSNQVSKIYAADAGLAHLRFWLRFLLSIKGLTPHQLEVAQSLIAEVGGMLNSWLKSKRSG